MRGRERWYNGSADRLARPLHAPALPQPQRWAAGCSYRAAPTCACIWSVLATGGAPGPPAVALLACTPHPLDQRPRPATAVRTLSAAVWVFGSSAPHLAAKPLGRWGGE